MFQSTRPKSRGVWYTVPMKKCKVKKMPNGRPEVEVGVQRRRSDIAPMTVEVDLDALRAAAARMKKAQVR